MPTILACNHPNSFLDALIIGSHYKRPVHYLARGDAFKKPLVSFLLRKLHMIPVYRLMEGRSQLKNNDATFEECLTILRNNGVLLIFSEGICKNQSSVLPLKKGTARLAFMGWQKAKLKNMVIRPVSLSYSSFSEVPMEVLVKEGETINWFANEQESAARFYQEFNARLHEQLSRNLVDKKEMRKARHFGGRKAFLAVPAFVGWATHKWLYNLLKDLARKKTANTVFFHSVLFGLLLFVYPAVLLVISLSLAFFTGQFLFLFLIFALPFCAWSYKEFKG